MGIYTTKSKWQGVLQPIVDFCVARRIHPNAFTYGALGLSLIAASIAHNARFQLNNASKPR